MRNHSKYVQTQTFQQAFQQPNLIQSQTYSVVLRILSVFGSQSAELKAKIVLAGVYSIRFTLGQPSLIISV